MSLKVVVFILIIYQFVKICNGSNVYCCLSCGDTQTMCKYNSSQPGEFCKGFISNQLTTRDKVKILTMHNKLRQEMALIPTDDFPNAGDMRELEWDNQLEETAQRWNTQCLFFDYDLCRSTPSFEVVGQNIGYKRAFRQRGTAEGVIQRWFNENAYIPKLYIIRLVNTSYYLYRGSYSMMPTRIAYTDFGHFTQLVWAKTYKVGCSVVRQRLPPFFSVNLVCNYYPAGNYLYQPVYTPGNPCEACPDGTECSKIHPGLCSHPSTNCKPNKIYPPFCDKMINQQNDVIEAESILEPEDVELLSDDHSSAVSFKFTLSHVQLYILISFVSYLNIF